MPGAGNNILVTAGGSVLTKLFRHIYRVAYAKMGFAGQIEVKDAANYSAVIESQLN